jgi:FkbM family methyltransferase
MPGVIIAETEAAFSAAMRRVLSGEVPSPPQDERLGALVWDQTLQPIVNLVRQVTVASYSDNSVQAKSDHALHSQDLTETPLPDVDPRIDSTTIEIMGHAAIVFGCPNDDYFIRLPAYAAQNSMFVAEALKLPRDGIVMDAGANVGVTAIIGSRCVPKGRVIAIEPSPLAHACLARTVAANALANCTIINKCLGETDGEVPFIEVPFLAGSHVGVGGAADQYGITADPFQTDSYVEADGASSVTKLVPMTTIDAVVAELSLQRLDLIKIDVEGFELDVLKGASQTIRRLCPRFVMEFNSFALTVNRNISPRSLLDFVLAKFGSFSTERDGVVAIIRTAREARDFLYSNMTTRYTVDDIVFGG